MVPSGSSEWDGHRAGGLWGLVIPVCPPGDASLSRTLTRRASGGKCADCTLVEIKRHQIFCVFSNHQKANGIVSYAEAQVCRGKSHTVVQTPLTMPREAVPAESAVISQYIRHSQFFLLRWDTSLLLRVRPLVRQRCVFRGHVL